MGGWAFILEDVLARERQAYDDLQLAYDKTAAALGKGVAERDDLAAALRDMVDLHDPNGTWKVDPGENHLPEAVAMRLGAAHSALTALDEGK